LEDAGENCQNVYNSDSESMSLLDRADLLRRRRDAKVGHVPERVSPCDDCPWRCRQCVEEGYRCEVGCCSERIGAAVAELGGWEPACGSAHRFWEGMS
jgi:hypothetical protein